MRTQGEKGSVNIKVAINVPGGHSSVPCRATRRPVNGYGRQKGGRLSEILDPRRDGTAKRRP